VAAAVTVRRMIMRFPPQWCEWSIRSIPKVFIR
jgi:hypothetical protein